MEHTNACQTTKEQVGHPVLPEIITVLGIIAMRICKPNQTANSVFAFYVSLFFILYFSLNFYSSLFLA